ncbi:MAG TPA: nitrate reductase molybdenum cofactor assembly chaperone [Streptosporangiaceae bacterium]|nr:nitrate reductase molybdenum cofactor assembly chaperone [Streptosporangiaceae bacterium]
MSRRSMPAAPGARRRARHGRVAYAAISALLRYPDEQLARDLPLLAAAAGTLPAAAGGPLLRLISHLAGEPLLSLQADYVATFDRQRRCCLYLSYYRNGDTRRRGAALWRFRDAYRQAGFGLVGSELPDYLPMLLELAASGGDGEVTAAGLMNEHREGIRMLLSALDARHSPYAGAVQALEAVLPPVGPHVIAEAARLACEGPPAELVGLEFPGSLEPYPLPAAQAGGRVP